MKYFLQPFNLLLPLIQEGMLYQVLANNKKTEFVVFETPIPGIMLTKNDDGPYKWANGLFPIHIHANFTILMGHLKF